jgi:hypothetical protein
MISYFFKFLFFYDFLRHLALKLYELYIVALVGFWVKEM